MKAYVITITDNPDSVKVAQRCVDSGKKFGLDIMLFDAITPRDEPVEMLEDFGIAPNSFDEKYSRNLNCISAFLSHYSLWMMCAKGNEPFVIFEHDAVLIDRIPTTPFHYVMNIGDPSYGKWNTPSLLGVNPLTTKRYFPTHMRIWSRPQGRSYS